MEVDLRKERSWSWVGPLEPAAIRPNTTWRDNGEKTELVSLASDDMTCFGSANETSFCLLIDSLRSITSSLGVYGDWKVETEKEASLSVS